MSKQRQFVKGARYEVMGPAGKVRDVEFVLNMGKWQLFKFVKRPSKRRRK